MNDKKIIFFLFSLISFILLAGTFFAYASISEGTFTISQCTTSATILKSETRYMGVSSSSGAQPKHDACDTNDILVCTGYQTGIILSACNVGASVAGTGKISNGMYFQFGRNKGFYYNNDMKYENNLIPRYIGLDSSKDNYGFIEKGGDSKWSQENGNFNWGNNLSSEKGRQGPCADGYHIPNGEEMYNIFNLFKINSSNLNIFPRNGGIISRYKYPSYIVEYEKDFSSYWIVQSDDINSGDLKVMADLALENGFGFITTLVDSKVGAGVRCFKNLGQETIYYTTEKIRVPFSKFKQAFQEYFEVDKNNYFKKFGKTYELVPVIEQPILLEDDILMFQDYKERLKNDVIYKKGGKYFYSNGGYYFVRIK